MSGLDLSDVPPLFEFSVETVHNKISSILDLPWSLANGNSPPDAPATTADSVDWLYNKLISYANKSLVYPPYSFP